MKTPEQLKGSIRSMAAKKNLRAQEVLQMFLFERILEPYWQRNTKQFSVVMWVLQEPEIIMIYIRLWDNYVAENQYIVELSFEEVLKTVEEVALMIGL